MRRILLFISGILILFLSGVGLQKANKNFLLLWNSNSLSVSAGSPLLADKVKVLHGISAASIDRPNDSELFKKTEAYSVLFDGTQKNTMINEYGENDFLLTYNDQYYLSFRQFKFNRRHQHDYNFYFFQKHDRPFVRVSIAGKDAMEFERPMIEISKAEHYRCNVPVDSAGYIYDMIELNKK